MTAGLLTFFVALLVVIICRPVAASANKPGIAAGLYRNTGSYGSPSWTVQTFVNSVRPSMPWGKVEAGARYTRANVYMKARADLSIEVMMKADAADTGYQAFRAASVSPTTVVDCLVLDGLISIEGACGFRGEFLVNLTGAPQEIDGSIYDTFELFPTWTSNAAGPSTVVMGSGSTPTLTAL